MKVKVIRQFYDKQENLKLRKVGEEFDVNENRANELENKGFITIVAKEKTTAKAKTTKKETKTAKADN